MNVSSKNPHPGAFIVIEGIDGAGKTTIAHQLVRELNDHPDYNGAIFLYEPGGTAFGKSLRSAIVETTDKLNPMTEVLGLIACKNELLHAQIYPAMIAGKIVICDRFTRTLMAYQGGMRGIPYEKIIQLLTLSDTLVVPHFEIFLDATEETTRLRRGKAINQFDELAALHSAKVREGFVEGKKHLPSYRSVTVQADDQFDTVFEQVSSEINRYLKFHRITGASLYEKQEYSSVRPDQFSLNGSYHSDHLARWTFDTVRDAKIITNVMKTP